MVQNFSVSNCNDPFLPVNTFIMQLPPPTPSKCYFPCSEHMNGVFLSLSLSLRLVMVMYLTLSTRPCTKERYETFILAHRAVTIKNFYYLSLLPWPEEVLVLSYYKEQKVSHINKHVIEQCVCFSCFEAIRSLRQLLRHNPSNLTTADVGKHREGRWSWKTLRRMSAGRCTAFA